MPEELDADTIDAAQRVHALCRPIALDPRFADNLLEEIMHTHSTTLRTGGPIPLRPLFGPIVFGPDAPAHRTPSRPRSAFGRLHTALSYALLAALVAAALGFAFWTAHRHQNAINPAPQQIGPPAATPTAGWTTMRGGPDRASTASQPGPIGTVGVGWTFRAPAEVHFPVWSGDTIYVNSAVGVLYAINRATGAQRWAVDTGSVAPDTVRFPSAVIGDATVYLPGSDGKVFAFKEATGEKIWSYDTGALTIASPALVNGVLYLNTTDGTIFALDAATGVLRWRASMVAASCCSNPAIADGLLFLGDDNGRVTAFDAAIGGRRWTAALTGQLRTPIAVDGEVFVMSGAGFVAAIGAQDGKVLWRYDPGTGLESIASPAVAVGRVFLNVGGVGEVALDAKTGKQLWVNKLPVSRSSSPAVAGNVVYVASLSDAIVELNAVSGAELGRIPLEGSDDATFAVGPGALYVTCAASDGILLSALVAGVATPVASAATPPVATASATPVAAQAGAAELVWEKRGRGFDDVAVAPLGRVWYDAFDTAEVRVVDLDGNEFFHFGGSGHGPGQFDFTSCQSGSGLIAFDVKGDALITGCDGRVQTFAPDGAFVSQFTATDPATGQPTAVVGIAIGKDGRIYLAAPDVAEVLVYDAARKPLSHFGGRRTGPHAMVAPVILHFAPDGNLWVNASSNGLDLYTPAGNYLRSLDGMVGTSAPGKFGPVNDFAVDAAGNLWITDFPNFRIQVITTEGSPLLAFGQHGTGPLGFSHPLSVALRGSSFFVTDEVLGVLHKYKVTLSPAGAAPTPEA